MDITMILILFLKIIIGGGIGYFLGESIYEYSETGNKVPMIVAIIAFISWVLFLIIW